MNRFTDNQDGTVTDSTTGLTWSKDTLAKGVTRKAAMEKLGDGWRLPAIEELFSLVDYSSCQGQSIDSSVFTDTESDWYWTSTPTAWNDGAFWVMDFYNGTVFNVGGGYGCVRAVRSDDGR